MRSLVELSRLLLGRRCQGVWPLLLAVSLFWSTLAAAGEVAVISDIQHWQHPVKAVFQKYKVTLSKVELQDQTYPVFYVKFPYDPMFGHNDNYFHPLYYDTLKANGFWNYAFVDQEGGHRINITWDKKSKTLSENIEDLKPDGNKP